MQNFQALRAPPPGPQPPVAKGGLPLDPKSSSPIANFWIRAWQLFTVYNFMLFCSFCFEQFFLDRSVATL